MRILYIALLFTTYSARCQYIGVNPFFVLDGKFSVNYEFNIANRPTLITTGLRYYSANYGIYSNYFFRPIELSKLNDMEIEIGLKRYTSPRRRLFFSVLGNVTYTNMKLKNISFLSPDSLTARGMVIGPEARVGVDLRVLKKRFVVQPILGIRYRFSLINFDKLTYDDRFWRIGTWIPSDFRLSRYGITQIRNQAIVTAGMNIFIRTSKK